MVQAWSKHVVQACGPILIIPTVIDNSITSLDLGDYSGLRAHLDNCMKESEGKQELLPGHRLGGAAGHDEAFSHVCISAGHVGFDPLGRLTGQLDAGLQD